MSYWQFYPLTLERECQSLSETWIIKEFSYTQKEQIPAS